VGWYAKDYVEEQLEQAYEILIGFLISIEKILVSPMPNNKVTKQIRKELMENQIYAQFYLTNFEK